MEKPTAESVISLYKDDDNFGFVLDLNDLLNFLDGFKDDELSLEEKNKILAKILEHNNSLYDRYAKLLKAPCKRESNQVSSENDTPTTIPYVTKTDVFDTSKIVKSLCGCTTLKSIGSHLPRITDKNYRKTISAILLQLRKKEQEDTEFVSSPENSALKEDAKALIDKYHDLYEAIIEYDKEQSKLAMPVEQEPPTIKEPKKKKLIFLRKASGNYYVDSDLKNIDEADNIIRLLEDIQNDNISEIKRYDNLELSDLLGVRKGKSRVFFASLDSNTVVILGFMIKRFQNNERFNDSLIQRTKDYHSQKESLLALKDSHSFIEEQENIFENVKDSIANKFGSRKFGDR